MTYLFPTEGTPHILGTAILLGDEIIRYFRGGLWTLTTKCQWHLSPSHCDNKRTQEFPALPRVTVCPTQQSLEQTFQSVHVLTHPQLLTVLQQLPLPADQSLRLKVLGP